ncbi:CAP domain-containing protein [Streptomyces sp. NBC_01089]|uniref:CAP domain-containing protein n=1 Tax=Streptomyces sp. NBC_01089 TaxID=2903747 RepID=UPI003867F1A6|nr:CAP domain-containing protein [Streptomyces sp. NBC_01089]
MRRRITVLVLVLASVLAAASPVVARTRADGGAEQRVLRLVNAARAEAGCRPLWISRQISRAARHHAGDLIRSGRYSHTGSDGSTPGGRISRAGYRWHLAGENVFLGPRDARQAVQGWLRSPEHRANILNCAYHHTGIAVRGPASHRMWVQDFAAH